MHLSFLLPNRALMMWKAAYCSLCTTIAINMVALEMNYLLYKTIKARLSQYMKGCRKGYETGRLLILFFKP